MITIVSPAPERCSFFLMASRIQVRAALRTSSHRHCPAQASWPNRGARREALRDALDTNRAARRGLSRRSAAVAGIKVVDHNHPPRSGTDGSQTRCWREQDSNHRSRPRDLNRLRPSRAQCLPTAKRCQVHTTPVE
jgi:hypothetical protein